MQSTGYELILEGLSDNSPETRQNLTTVLTSTCGFKIIEVDSILSQGPCSIRHSADREELSAIGESLRLAGGKVLIVRTSTSPEQSFSNYYARYISDLSATLNAMNLGEVDELLADFLMARKLNHQIFILGNGGSAANASHMANDFSKNRFDDEKYLFRVMSLTDNVSWLTATANDYGYDYIFVNQLKNLLQPKDLVIAISSSGNSPNILHAVDYANAKGALTYGIVGFGGGELRKRAKKSIYIPTQPGQYGLMEDVTLTIGHVISTFIYEMDRQTVGV